MKKAPQPFTVTEPSYSSNFNIHYDAIKQKFLAGKRIRVIDYPEEQRHDVIGVIALLRDQLPIVACWQTLRQSYKSEVRTRAIRYYIPESFLRDCDML